MKFSYEDLISGDSLPVDGVGHIHSPLLKELKPTQGIGMWTYNLYLNILSWGKEDLVKFLRVSMARPLKALEETRLNAFDVATIFDSVRELLQNAMAFFMDENIVWNKDERIFITQHPDTNKDIGRITRDNFDDVRDMMLQVNYINFEHSTKPIKYSSKKAQELWERAQQHLKAAAKHEDKRMQLGNIISKLSCASAGYTLLNIYDLTIFQLYDQFFQHCYLRSMHISDMVFSNHGGKDFDVQAWLKPITNFEKEKQQ